MLWLILVLWWRLNRIDKVIASLIIIDCESNNCEMIPIILIIILTKMNVNHDKEVLKLQ